MGATVSSSLGNQKIDESALVFTGTINACPLFTIKSCVCRNVVFKETTIIQYTKDSDMNFPDKLRTSTTLKAIVNTEFSYERLVEQTLRVKHLSHPSVIRVSSNAFSPNLSALFLVSEPSLALQDLLKTVTKDEFLAGLQSVLQAMDFLHSRASVSHNNIDIPSLFVDSRKKWKLGLFEYSCNFQELSQNRLEVLEALKGRTEDVKATKISESAFHAYDIYCFSRMVHEQLQNLNFDISDLQTVLERSGSHASPRQRPSAAQLLNHSAFKGPYSYLLSFLSDYVLKSDNERFHFFGKFPTLARQIPEELLCSSIIPLILVPSVFTDFPTKSVIQHLLTPYKEETSIGLVSEDAFRRLIVPHISRLFRHHELTTRLLLLQHFHAYARLMGRSTLEGIVLPEVWYCKCLSNMWFYL
uniref:Protein kinase domain-containing protein n=1 Tax=Mesocestoides corti TaxID=53468 RepID=A0A5K3FWQ0_MESCO